MLLPLTGIKSIPKGDDSDGIAFWLYRRSEKAYAYVYQVLWNVYAAYDVACDFFKLPQIVHVAAKIIGYSGVVDVVFAGPRLITDITDTVKSRGAWGLVNEMLVTASEICNIASVCSLVVAGMKELGCIAKDALTWTDQLDYLFIPDQCIMLFQSAEQLLEVERTRVLFFEAYQTKETFTLQERINTIKSGCHLVIKRGDDLQSVLSLSRFCALKDRARALLERIVLASELPAKLAEEGEEFFDILAKRINNCCTLDIVNLMISVVSTILTTASVLAFPLSPFALVLIVSTTVASIALPIIHGLNFTKNPFPERTCSPGEHVPQCTLC